MDLFGPIHKTQLNKIIQLIKMESRLGLKAHQLDLESLRIISREDASFANLPDLKTQLGSIVLLTDKTSRENCIHFRSCKCKRVVRSVLVGETHAFVDSFDAAYAIRHDLRTMLGKPVTLIIVTDSDSLFKFIIQSSTTTETRLLIDVQAGREAYQQHKIENMGWIKSDWNVADGLTKINSPDLMQRVMRTGRLDRIADQWVIRPPVKKHNDTLPDDTQGIIEY